MYIKIVNGEEINLTQDEVDELERRNSAWITYTQSLEYRQKEAVSKRVYPTLGDQLDMIYKDKINNTTIWLDTITAIKTANPKPTE